MATNPSRRSRASRAVHSPAKRLLDVSGAVFGLVFLSPVFLSAAASICFSMGLPVLFRQMRPGLRGVPFKLAKFRTMRAARSDEVWFRSDENRLLPLGRFLRQSSIDELPALWNVLRGEMSLVGPRPLLLEYLEKYTSEQNRRHDVRPGITGWAQVNGRQNITFSKRLELDVWYVDNWSFWLDIKILWMTISSVFRSHGVQSGQNVDEVDDLGLSPDRDLKANAEQNAAKEL